MPIIVLSAVGDEEEKVRALDAGADDYVTKPFGPSELVARLEAALRRAGAGADEPVLGPAASRSIWRRAVVRRDGEEVHLTPIEFELLRALARNRGRLLTHGALLTEVWGPAYADDDRGPAHPHREPAPEGRARRDARAHPHRPRRRLPLRRHEPRSDEILMLRG